MNTLFHVLDDEDDVVISILFKMPPEIALGYKPELGKRVWIGAPVNLTEMPYEIVGIGEEDEEDHGLACALRLQPQRMLNS